MSIKLFIFTATVLGICYLNAQTERPALRSDVNLDYQYSPILVKTNTDTTLRGLFTGVSDDSLYLRSENQNYAFSRSQLNSFEIKPAGRDRGELFTGALLGMYAGSLIFFRAEGQPAVFDDAGDLRSGNILGLFFAYAGFYSVGGFLGWWTNHTSPDAERYALGMNEDRSQREWRKFQRATRSNGQRGAKVHIRTVMGPVFPTQSTDFSEYGFTESSVSSHRSRWNPEIRNTNGFNMARRVELAYSIRPHIRVGVAASWFGEPAVVKYNSPETIFGESLIQHTRAVGGFVTAAYVFPLLKDRKDLLLVAAIGVGAAEMEIEREHMEPFSVESLVVIQSAKKTSYASMVAAQVEWYMYPNLSFDLGFDFTAGQVMELEEYPALGLPADDVFLANGSFNVSIGLHF